jgi:hypothetical protein
MLSNYFFQVFRAIAAGSSSYPWGEVVVVRGGAVEGGILSPRQQGARGHAARGDQSDANLAYYAVAIKDPQ